MIECFLESVHPGADAAFGLNRPIQQIWHSNLLETRFGPLEGSHPLAAGDVEFLLRSSFLGDLVSSDPDRCRMNMLSGGDVVEFHWEEGSNRSFDDYVLRVVHR